jgi:Glyoxalase superfamily protein
MISVNEGKGLISEVSDRSASKSGDFPRSPRLTRSVPTLPSLDFNETSAFYRRLGFAEAFRDLALMCMERDGVRLHFWLTGNARIPQSTSCWIDVVGIDALHADFEPLRVIHRRGGLETKPWGIREFDVADCHGNLIRFCEAVAVGDLAISGREVDSS